MSPAGLSSSRTLCYIWTSHCFPFWEPACRTFVFFRLLLQLTQSQQTSFALERNLRTQWEIEDKMKGFGFKDDTLQLMTEVRDPWGLCERGTVGMFPGAHTLLSKTSQISSAKGLPCPSFPCLGSLHPKSASSSSSRCSSWRQELCPLQSLLGPARLPACAPACPANSCGVLSGGGMSVDICAGILCVFSFIHQHNSLRGRWAE